MEPTQPESCRGCSLFGVGKGFVLGCGDPEKAKYAVILEAPGRSEPSFELKPNPKRWFLQTREECEEELAVRRRDYPGLAEKWLRVGVPAVADTGAVMQFWVGTKVGVQRAEMFIDNTLRCLPPKGKSGAAYPIGETKKAAELHCRQYDRLDKFRPDAVVFSLHPASLSREISPLTLVIKDFERVRDFAAQGRRVMVLLGGKAVHAFMRYGSNVTRWRSHYAALAADWSERYKDLFAYRRKERRRKVTIDDTQSEFFGVPEVTLAKVRERAEPKDGVCGKRHRKEPRCHHVGCEQKWKEDHGTDR